MSPSRGTMSILFSFVLGAAAYADPPAIPAPPKPTAASRPAGSKADPRTIAILLSQGDDALAAQDFRAARDAFMDVMSLEPGNAHAQEGAAVAHVHLSDFPRARDELERSMGPGGPTRSQVITAASIYTRTKNPMRAAKLIKQYLAAHPQADEPVLNALAAALGTADEQARKNRLFLDCATLYDSENTKLEATRSGMKRWGTEWLDSGAAEQKGSAWRRVQGEADQVSTQINSLNRDRSRAESELARRQSAAKFGHGSGWQGLIQQQRQEIDRINQQIAAAELHREQILASGERPPLPKSIDPAPPEMKPPAVASAGSESAQPAPATERPKPDEVAVAPTPPSPSPPPSPDPAPSEPAPQPSPRPAETRKHRVSTYAAAFAVAPDLLVTAAAAVPDGSKIEVQNADGAAFDAELVRTDADSGLALLRVNGQKLNYLSVADSFAGGSVTCVSFPVPNLFQPKAEVIGGSAVAVKSPWEIRLSRSPRLGGGPLLVGGKVVGVELATRDSEAGTTPAASLDQLRKLVGSDLPPGGGISDGASVTMQLSAVHEN